MHEALLGGQCKFSPSLFCKGLLEGTTGDGVSRQSVRADGCWEESQKKQNVAFDRLILSTPQKYCDS